MSLKNDLRTLMETQAQKPRELQGPYVMTDDSEVREGDVREFRGVVVSHQDHPTRASIRFAAPDDKWTIWVPRTIAAASTLISRKVPEIKVGSRVRVWSGTPAVVDAISADGMRAYLRAEPGHAAFPSSDGIALSDLTLVEDPTDA